MCYLKMYYRRYSNNIHHTKILKINYFVIMHLKLLIFEIFGILKNYNFSTHLNIFQYTLKIFKYL